MILKINFLLLFLVTQLIYAKECSPYFNPENFYAAPPYLEELLIDVDIKNEKVEFELSKSEIYKYTQESIASDINDNFGGFWNDWIEDAYEMQLTPNQTLFKYKDNYLSLEVYIYGVIGDATKYKGTIVTYKFYNYTQEVNKYILCQSKKGLKK